MEDAVTYKNTCFTNENQITHIYQNLIYLFILFLIYYRGETWTKKNLQYLNKEQKDAWEVEGFPGILGHIPQVREFIHQITSCFCVCMYVCMYAMLQSVMLCTYFQMILLFST